LHLHHHFTPLLTYFLGTAEAVRALVVSIAVSFKRDLGIGRVRVLRHLSHFGPEVEADAVDGQ
jgi:hypothetical protein